jgi:hypothetical protein
VPIARLEAMLAPMADAIVKPAIAVTTTAAGWSNAFTGV